MGGLTIFKASLMESIDMSDEMSDAPKGKAEERWKQIERFLEGHDVIQNVDVRPLCGCFSGDSQSHPCEAYGRGKAGKIPRGRILGIPKERSSVAASAHFAVKKFVECGEGRDENGNCAGLAEQDG